MKLNKITLTLLREQHNLKPVDVAEELGYSVHEYKKLEKHLSDLKLVDYALLCQFYQLSKEDAALFLNTVMCDGLDVEDDYGEIRPLNEYMAVIGA